MRVRCSNHRHIVYGQCWCQVQLQIVCGKIVGLLCLVRFPSMMLVDVMSVMGQESFTKIVTPRASDRSELKYNLCFVAFW